MMRLSSWHGTVILALTLAGTISAHADTYPRQPGVDARHYVFRLSLLTSDSNEIEGEATTTFRLLASGVREITLDLATPRADGRGMTVATVTSQAGPVPFTHRENRLRLTLPAGAAAGQDVTFTITYRGIPADGLRLINNIHGERTAFSENWYNRARQWLPMIDHVADKATGEFIITTRADYQVVANGALVEETDLDGGRRRTHWRQDVPISSWLYAVGIARFAVRHAGLVRGVPLEYWVFPQDAAKGFALFERDARRSFEFFADSVGPYAYQKLAHVEAAGMGGGTEHASSIFYGEKGITAGNGPVVHEVAHQWFGNAITENDWNDIWLSEGFATYFTLLYTEHAEGRDAFAEGLRRSRATVLRVEASLPNAPVVHVNHDDAVREPTNALVYQKGAWILHMLREQVGTETFWRGIRDYYRRHMNGTASTDDFRQVMEQASGQNLTWFFRQWLNRSGVPALSGTWHYDATAKEVVVTVRQTHTAAPYRLSLGVGLVSAAGALPSVRQMAIDGGETTSRFSVASEPAAVIIDPAVSTLADFGAFVKTPPPIR
ncbi:MAG: M1 family peptidase [Acidobacteria bacterium]|nr:M1 family peptidase [Acidobacteriota bacterium]